MTRAELLQAYNRCVSQRNSALRRLRKLQKKVAAGDGGQQSSSNRTIPVRTTHAREDSNEKSVANRRHRLYKALSSFLRLRPTADHAYAINDLIQHLTIEQRSELRALNSVQQERFLAQRDLCRHLRTQHFTPKVALTMRLENFLPTRALERANTMLSK
eukprot:2036811-Pleurochrysis_carterae.AAC.1